MMLVHEGSYSDSSRDGEMLSGRWRWLRAEQEKICLAERGEIVVTKSAC